MIPYMDKTLTIRQRVQDLLGRMTLQEKIGQVNQHLYGWQSYYKDDSGFHLTDAFKKHVTWGQGLGALYGLFRADPWSQKDYHNGIRAKDSLKMANQIQSYVIKHSRLGIPTLIVEEMPHGHQALDSTVYPTNIGKSNSFDPKLLRKISELQAEELRLKGGNLALVSSLDLLKDPRWGRSEETLGESPYLTKSYTQSIIDGFQGDLIKCDDFLDEKVSENAREHVGVVIKHLIGQGDALGGHNSGTVPIGQREFLEVYEPIISSLKRAVGVMAAYNDLDGVPCHANRYLLHDVLREKNEFQGIVMADGTALDRLVDLYGDCNEAVEAALKAGVDISLWDDVYTNIEAAIKNNPELIQYLNESVARVLSIKFLLGLFDHPLIEDVNANNLTKIISESKTANLAMAIESITLVKNSIVNGHKLLPLKKGIDVAVVGPQSDNIYHWLGDYTPPQTTSQYRSLTTAVKSYCREVTQSLGSEVREKQNNNSLISKAVESAKNADAIVLTLGGSSMREFDMSFLNNGALKKSDVLNNTDTGENVDVANLTLGGDQLALLRALKKTNKPIVAVMVQGRPYDITSVVELADAVLISWYPGQQGPQAVADILFGQSQPSGKLSISYPRNSGQLPVYYYQRRVLKNENYFDEKGSPLYKFGYGLSYAEFSYDQPIIKRESNGFKVSVKVNNISDVTGTDTLLIFTSLYGTDVLPRLKKLINYQKITLSARSSKTFEFSITEMDLKYLSRDMSWKKAKEFQVEISGKQSSKQLI